MTVVGLTTKLNFTLMQLYGNVSSTASYFLSFDDIIMKRGLFNVKKKKAIKLTGSISTTENIPYVKLL